MYRLADIQQCFTFSLSRSFKTFSGKTLGLKIVTLTDIEDEREKQLSANFLPHLFVE